MDNLSLTIFATVILAAAVVQLPLTIGFLRDALADWRMAHSPDIKRRLQGDFIPCQNFAAPPTHSNSVSSFPSLTLPKPPIHDKH